MHMNRQHYSIVCMRQLLALHQQNGFSCTTRQKYDLFVDIIAIPTDSPATSLIGVTDNDINLDKSILPGLCLVGPINITMPSWFSSTCQCTNLSYHLQLSAHCTDKPHSECMPLSWTPTIYNVAFLKAGQCTLHLVAFHLDALITIDVDITVKWDHLPFMSAAICMSYPLMQAYYTMLQCSDYKSDKAIPFNP